MKTPEGAITLFINDQQHVVHKPDPNQSLVDYITTTVQLQGTKKSCEEGSCGSCTIVMKRENEFISMNSCLRRVVQCDNQQFYTIEYFSSGCGSAFKQNPLMKHIHNEDLPKIIAENNGSQCGMCTPGFVNSLAAFALNHPKEERNLVDIENLFDGNACRCTGYRPILYGSKTIASCDNKTETENTPRFRMESCSDSYAKITATKQTEVKIWSHPKCEPKHEHVVKHILDETNTYNFISGLTSIEALHTYIHQIVPSEQLNMNSVKFVGANTSEGIYKRLVYDPKYMFDISAIGSLKNVEVNDSKLTIGAGCTVSELNKALLNHTGKEHSLYNSVKFLDRIASTQLRNIATIGGNLAMTKIFGFASDLAIALVGMNASVEIVTLQGSVETRKLTLSDLYNGAVLGSNLFLITKVSIPLKLSNTTLLRCYKTAKRLEFSHAIANGSIRFEMDQDSRQIIDVSIAYIFHDESEKPIPFRLMSTSSNTIKRLGSCLFSDDKSTIIGTLHTITAQLSRELHELQLTCSQMTAALNFFFKYILEFLYTHHKENQIEAAEFEDFFQRRRNEVQKGIQSISQVNTFVAAQPIIKRDAHLQAQGLATYSYNSIPVDQNYHTLHGGFILSEKAFYQFEIDVQQLQRDFKDSVFINANTLDQCLLKNDFEAAYDNSKTVRLPGVSSKHAGKVVPIYGNTIFAQDFTLHSGQSLALVLCASDSRLKEVLLSIYQNHSKYIIYSGVPCDLCDQNGEKILDVQLPIFEIEENESLRVKAPGVIDHLVRNIDYNNPVVHWDQYTMHENENGTEESKTIFVEGRADTSPQAHVYLETQNAVARPTDTGGIHIVSSTQMPMELQSWIGNLLSIPCNEVIVEIGRLGGAFGGKATHSAYTALAASAAARITNRQVRIMLDRRTDSKMIGKRHPVFGKYKIAADSKTGIIKCAEFDLKFDAGCTGETSASVAFIGAFHTMSPYYVDHFLVRTSCWMTNTVTNTAFRTFGSVQSNFVSEMAMEHLCEELVPRHIAVGSQEYMEQLYYNKFAIRQANFYQENQKRPYGEIVTEFNLSKMWNELHGVYSDWSKQVVAFNSKNTFKKQGIAIMPQANSITYNLFSWAKAEATVCVFNADGSVLIRTGVIEMGQGAYTKIIQAAAQTLGIPSDMIKIGKYIASLANPTQTGGSSGVEVHGRAMVQACDMLRSSLSKKIDEWINQSNNNSSFCPSAFNAHRHLFDKLKHICYGKESKDYSRLWINAKNISDEELVQIWKIVINQAYDERSQLMFTGHAITGDNLVDIDLLTGKGTPSYHRIHSACISVVELDMLTGEMDFRKAKILYDIGCSLNAAIDVGQIEGGFIQGVGMMTTEEVEYDKHNGEVSNDGFWEYKIPSAKMIPQEFIVEMWPKDHVVTEALSDPSVETVSPNTPLLSSKAVGEPPLILSSSAFMAIRDAVRNFRQQFDSSITTIDFHKAPASSVRILERALDASSVDWSQAMMNYLENHL